MFGLLGWMMSTTYKYTANTAMAAKYWIFIVLSEQKIITNHTICLRWSKRLVMNFRVRMVTAALSACIANNRKSSYSFPPIPSETAMAVQLMLYEIQKTWYPPFLPELEEEGCCACVRVFRASTMRAWPCDHTLGSYNTSNFGIFTLPTTTVLCVADTRTTHSSGSPDDVTKTWVIALPRLGFDSKLRACMHASMTVLTAPRRAAQQRANWSSDQVALIAAHCAVHSLRLLVFVYNWICHLHRP